MALTFAAYAAPGHERLAGVIAVIALTALGCLGVQKSALATRVIVVVVLAVLAVVVVACFAGGTAEFAHLRPFPGGSTYGILQAGGLLFFAFAGYARIATLGEEVRDPKRTIPRAVAIALAITLLAYVLVDGAALLALGAHTVGASPAPLRADERRPPRWIPVLGVLGCAVLAVALPWQAALAGAGS